MAISMLITFTVMGYLFLSYFFQFMNHNYFNYIFFICALNFTYTLMFDLLARFVTGINTKRYPFFNNKTSLSGLFEKYITSLVYKSGRTVRVSHDFDGFIYELVDNLVTTIVIGIFIFTITLFASR